MSAAELAELEPNLTREVSAGAYYPQDMQVQPMLAAARAVAAGAQPAAPPCTPAARSSACGRARTAR